MTIDDDLAEFDREADFYIPMEELKQEKDPRYQQLVAGQWEGHEPEAFESGVVGAMDRVIVANPSLRVAVVCHGGVINAYLAHVLGLPEPLFFYPEYTGISRVMASRSGPRSIVSINEASHLRGLT